MHILLMMFGWLIIPFGILLFLSWILAIVFDKNSDPKPKDFD